MDFYRDENVNYEYQYGHSSRKYKLKYSNDYKKVYPYGSYNVTKSAKHSHALRTQIKQNINNFQSKLNKNIECDFMMPYYCKENKRRKLWSCDPYKKIIISNNI